MRTSQEHGKLHPVLAGLLLAIASCASWSGSRAQTPLSDIQITSDTAARIPHVAGGLASGDDESVFRVDNQADAGSVYDRFSQDQYFELSAVDINDAIFYRFSLDTVANIEGTLVRPGDVFDYRAHCATSAATRGLPCTANLIFDARANNIPDNVGVDAVSTVPDSGDLLLSFNSTFMLGSDTARPADIFRFDGGSFTRVFDGSQIPANANLDGLHRLDNKNFLLSFDVEVNLPTGEGLMVAADDDIIEYDPSAGTFTLAYRLRDLHASWFPADVGGIWAETLADMIFSDRFET